MATPASAAPIPEANGAPSKLHSTGPSQSKASFAARVSDSMRKSDDGGQPRRAAHPSAWTSGVNPITQRGSNSSLTNGIGARGAGPGDKACADRQTWVFGNAMGLECHLTTKAGQAFSGVFVGLLRSGDEPKLVLKMVKDLAAAYSDDGAVTGTTGSYAGHGPDHKMVFPVSSVQVFEVPQAPIATKGHTANGGFRTDGDISGNTAMRERLLQRWDGGPTDKNVDLSLESSTGGWDQFKANEQQFGLKSDYDENLYTTRIDRSNPLYAMREKDAERIAREIEGSTSTNAHVREERGIVDDGADDEEKYSGVRRDLASLQSNQPNRYIPPSRRNQASTEAGAPIPSRKESAVDPAIISAQMARPAESDMKTSAKPASAVSTNEPVVPQVSSTAPPVPSKDPQAALQPSKPGDGTLTTNSIEQKVLDSFHQFSTTEKIKVLDQKRTRQSADKAVRINELKKFSINFKLLTPVPKDLVPILAKDESKQKEIVQNAQKNADSTKSTKIATLVEPQKLPRTPASATRETENASASGSSDRARQPSAPSALQPASQTQAPQPNLTAKLSDHHRNHIAGTQAPVPTPLPIHDQRKPSQGSTPQNALPSPQKATTIRGPTASGPRLNVNATEFKPTAAPFKPASTATTVVASSPRSGLTTRTLSPAAAPPKFFSEIMTFKKYEDRPTPLSVSKQKRAGSGSDTGGAESGAKATAPPIPAVQGGFQYPYRTAPTWTIVDNPDHEPDYKAVFLERRPRRLNTTHSHASPGAGMPHPYSMPPQIPAGNAGMPHMQQHHHHTPQLLHQQPHYGHPPQFDDHHMRPSASNSSVFTAPSPRMQQPNMVYSSPMPGPAQMAYTPHMPYQMPTPPMGGRQFSNGPPMGPMQGGHLAAPMMVPQHSAGGFMPQQMAVPYNGQMPMYAGPGPTPGVYGSPSQPNSGFPSPGPGRAAPMMMHQSSQPGQQPIFVPTNQYGQPMYPQQPGGHMVMRPVYASPQSSYTQHSYPQHQYAQQVHRTPSQGYAQPHHTPQQQQQSHAAPQPAAPAAKPSEAGDEAKTG